MTYLRIAISIIGCFFLHMHFFVGMGMGMEGGSDGIAQEGPETKALCRGFDQKSTISRRYGSKNLVFLQEIHDVSVPLLHATTLRSIRMVVVF